MANLKARKKDENVHKMILDYWRSLDAEEEERHVPKPAHDDENCCCARKQGVGRKGRR